MDIGSFFVLTVRLGLAMLWSFYFYSFNESALNWGESRSMKKLIQIRVRLSLSYCHIHLVDLGEWHGAIYSIFY